jgi:hypothetical protein
LEYERAVVASKGVPTRHGWGKAYQEWEDSNDPNKYIYMPTEMLHGLYDGGAGAGLEDYWSMMRESPVLGGGFLWVLFDEALRHPETGQLDAAGNQAPDGIVGPYREREGSFFTIKELWSPIVVTRQDDDAILVENRYSFFDANQCTATWELIEFRTPEEKEAGRRVVASGRLELPSIPPGESRAVPLKLTAHSPAVDALAVRVDDPHGRELWRWVWPLRELAVIEPIAQAPSADAFSIADDDAFYTITCGEFAWRFRKNDGRLEEARRGEQAFSLRNGPIATPGESQLAGPLEFSNENGSQIVTARYTGSLQEVKWTMRPDGWLRCEYRYTAEGEHEYFGVTFDYPEDQVRGKRWLGEGPFRVWKNRRQGVTLGVWQNETNNTITGYRYEGYPEFKGCFSGVHWMQLETSEGPITIVPHDASQFVQVLTPELPPDELVAKTKVTLPTCGIAILDAIPPVGSKFKDTITSGPQGQPNVAEGEYHGAVSIRVGE